MSELPKPYLTPEQYLEIERAAEFRSEYFQGEMLAMGGAREAHNLLVGNLLAELHGQFRQRQCRVYPSDMRVRVSAVSYTYPDVIALCGDRQFLDDRTDTLLNPTVIVEVLSPSTEAYDRGRKFEMYQGIESLKEYVLVASDRVHVDRYTRMAHNRWIRTSYDGLAETLELESVGASVLLADLYEKVEFPPV